MNAPIERKARRRLRFERINVDADESAPSGLAQQDVGQDSVAAAEVEPQAAGKSVARQRADLDGAPECGRWLSRVCADERGQKFTVCHGTSPSRRSTIACCSLRIESALAGPIGSSATLSPAIARAKRSKTWSLP